MFEVGAQETHCAPAGGRTDNRHRVTQRIVIGEAVVGNQRDGRGPQGEPQHVDHDAHDREPSHKRDHKVPCSTEQHDDAEGEADDQALVQRSDEQQVDLRVHELAPISENCVAYKVRERVKNCSTLDSRSVQYS